MEIDVTLETLTPFISEIPCKKTQRVQSTYIVDCRVSILGIHIMIWESIPHKSTQALVPVLLPGLVLFELFVEAPFAT